MTEIALMTAPAGFVPDCVTVNYGNSGTVQRFDNGLELFMDLKRGAWDLNPYVFVYNFELWLDI